MKTSSRRNFIVQLSLVSLFAGSGCSAIAKIALSYPDEYDTNTLLVQNNLRAFASTVLPGIDVQDPNIIKAFSDEYYPFYKIRGFFLHCLNKASKRQFRTEQFCELNEDQRKYIVQDFLDAGGRKRQLFKVAILLVQTSFYSGIYDASKGCKTIGFTGLNYGFREEDMYFQNAAQYVSEQQTLNGNYS